MDSKPKHVVMIQIDITCFINKFVSHKYVFTFDSYIVVPKRYLLG